MPSPQEILTAELQEVECRMRQEMEADQGASVVSSLCQSVLSSGGKRLRPRLTLMCMHLLHPDPDEKEHEMGCACACAIELLHTATLVHDDVIDESRLRRGQPTINARVSSHAAVLAGDYLFTRCFHLLRSLESMDIFALAARAVSLLVSGELQQQLQQGQLDMTLEDYRQTIYCKTGALFALACQSPAIYLKARKPELEALGKFAEAFGAAFQMRDDLLDYLSDTTSLGKQVGDDLNAGRVTLPLLLTLRDCPEERRAELEQAVRHARLETVLNFIRDTGAISSSRALLSQYIDEAVKALEAFTPGPWRTALEDLARAQLDRAH